MAIPSRTVGSFIRAVCAVVAVAGMLIQSTVPVFAAGGQTGNLQGIVVDAGTKAPIQNASITAVSPSSRYSAQTNARGQFDILNLTVDTYTVTITEPGYDSFTINGVTIAGDNTTNLGSEALQKALKTIGKTTARSRSSEFQPTQTVDSVTVSGQRAEIATGKLENTSENQVALSVPGVQLTNGNRLTIRGGLSTEVGYQLDGIDFTEPFLFGNANNGVLVGAGSVQVVEGAGDATQGNVGGGVINSVIKRGTNPPFGLLDLEAGGPNYNHQGGVEYGFATPDGRISDYITFVGQRFAPYYGAPSSNQTNLDNYDRVSFVTENDFVNNFVLHFGKGNNQSFQVAYLNHDLVEQGDLSGLQGRLPQNYNPYNLANLPFGVFAPDGNPAGNPSSYNFITSRYGLEPFQTGADVGPSIAEDTAVDPTRYLKFEYTNSLTPTTYLDISTANVQQLVGQSNWYGLTEGDAYSITGGQNTTLKVELTHQFGTSNTTTVGVNLDNKHPLWNDYDPFLTALLLEAFSGSGLASTDEYALPANTKAPVSAANPCPVTTAAGCYLYEKVGYTGRLPLFGINYNGTDNQEYGAYLRDQFTASKLHLDAGLRFDGLNWKQGANPFNTQPGALSNPDDVPVGIGPGNPPNFLRDDVVHPKFIEPRLAAAYEFDPNDSFRAGYGRSVIFPNAQSLGTPMYLSGLPSNVLNLAPTPGTNTSDPATWTCGATNPQWAASQSSANYTSSGGSRWQCKTYGQELYWELDQNFDAPDVGNNQPQTTSNTDLTYQHQFKNGLSAKFTTYYKREFNVPAFSVISQVLNAQGVPISQVFGVDNVGINKTSGVEFGLQTADKPAGFAGYLSATYTNVIDSVPPLVASEDSLPLIPSASLILGDQYRAGYVSPFVVNLGVQYKTHNGFRINPVLSYDRGFPIGVGNTIASADPFGGYANLPQSNINVGALSGYAGITGAFNATNYVDPVNPGTIIKPNIAATRGTPETSSAGGFLSKPRLNTNVTFEFTRNRNTFGLLVQNLFGNQFGEPIPNPYYQPVATGIAGAQTGQTTAAIPGTLTYAYGGFRNIPNYIYGQSAYVLPIGQIGSNVNTPLTFRAYYQLSL